MRRSVLVLSMLAFGSQSARAWDADLVCPMPELTPLASSVDEGGSMCLLETPHVVRAPILAEWPEVSDQEQAEDAPAVARSAYERARQLTEQGAYDDALLHLRVVEATMPRLADHAALWRAELHMKAGQPARAAEAYRAAMQKSQGLDLGARAHVGYVQSLLQSQSSLGPKELDALLARYPELPEAPLLRFELAQYRERAGQVRTALLAYRSLDLTLPGYPVAERARQRLRALAEQGHKAPPFSALEQIERAERLVRSGPVELAEQVLSEVAALPLPKALVPRREALLPALQAKTGPRGDSAVSIASAASEELKKRLARETTAQRLPKLRPVLLLALLSQATGARLREESDALLGELSKRAAQVPAELRFEALVSAMGNASEASLIGVADTLLSHPTLGVAARYHRARCLEPLEPQTARSEHLRVMQDDTGPTRFYAQFAEQRLRVLDSAYVGCQAPGRDSECNHLAIESVLARLERRRELDFDQLVGQLGELAARHGQAYPWLPRAADLLVLGEPEAAGDELHEAYLAWRWVARRGPLRAGRVAIYRGKSIVQPAPDFATQRARMQLDTGSRELLAQVALAIGDVGTAVEFGGPRFAEREPDAYASEVARVARKYRLDPDLLFAVMRVESVFQRRIISHAGAIGLMQIMPRTGRLIADKLGLYDTTAADLLDPRFNLELSGWYLSSLLERMDGRLPLAIASYNGGPHNVRRWIDEFGAHVPLDAFLERIPFRETKRYVRRVLGYYAKYKAARGQTVDLISLSLPQDKPNGVAF